MSRLMIAIGSAILLLAGLTSRAMAQKEYTEEDFKALMKFPQLKEDPKDDALRKLLKERYQTALNEMYIRVQRLRGGQEFPERSIRAAHRVVEAGLEVYAKPADQLILLEKEVAIAKYFEKTVQDMVTAGVKNYTAADSYEAQYARQTAEIRLLRFKEKMKGDKK